MRDFKKLLMWQNAVDLVNVIYQASDDFPEEERDGMRLRMIRTAVAIPTHIALGSSKESVADFKYFLEVARCSAFELGDMLSADNLRCWLDSRTLRRLLFLVAVEQKEISLFMEKLKA